MATTRFMIQLYSEQHLAPLVTEVYPLDDEAYLFLDPSKNTVVREIATQEVGGILASRFSGAVPIGFSSKSFAELKLVPPDGDGFTSLYPPTHVSSPALAGFALAVLHLYEPGLSVTSSARLSLFRGIGAHAYVDQTD
jgi:hypothetical protein